MSDDPFRDAYDAIKAWDEMGVVEQMREPADDYVYLLKALVQWGNEHDG